MTVRRVALTASGAVLVLASLSCGGPTSPTPPTVPNQPPNLAPLKVASARVEVGEGVEVTAVVTDAETSEAGLSFEWSATMAGSFSGTGSRVTWQPAADVETPADATINLTVVERYTVSLGGGRSETREHRAYAMALVRVNNSVRETTQLATQFLTDFSNSAVSADTCLRNFTDECEGKRREHDDIVADRALYWITSSSFHVERVELNATRTRAVIWAPCEFTDRRLSDGAILHSSGVCLLTAVYHPSRWWLCNSNWCRDYGCQPNFSGGSSMRRYVERCP